jgi:hypothetical protein
MSEGLERLKNIGAQKIYEETHIPVEHVQAIIHESFDGFSKVQFLGFVSILEREYNEDLTELRLKGLENFETEKDVLEGETEGVFVVPKRKKKLTLLYVSLALLVFVVVAYLNISSDKEVLPVTEVDNSLIIDVQKNIDLNDSNDTNESFRDANDSLADINSTEQDLALEEEIIPRSLKFITKTKLWLGYIDVKTNKHHNKIFTGEFELDADKDWLLVFGHKFVDVAVNNELMKVDTKKSLRFLYENGEMQALTLREFKKLNRGRTW